MVNHYEIKKLKKWLEIYHCDSKKQSQLFNFPLSKLINGVIMKIRPLHDRIVVRRTEEEQKTAGGILLPGSAAEKPQQGEVIAAGNGLVRENGEVRPLDVAVGDVVLFGQYSGQTVKVDGEELLILKESDVLGVLEA
jgi:chaperonin 10 Kd subunit